MNTILTPTDFSKNALNAVKYAVSYAAKTNSKLLIFHSYNYPVATIHSPVESLQILEEIAKKNAEMNMKKLLRSLSKSFPEVPLSWEISVGYAPDDIINCVMEKKIKLVIMATTGLGAIARVFIGSTTKKVVANVQCPVIVVPSKTKFKEINKIGFATSLEEDTVKTIKETVAFAKQFDAQIDVIHIQDFENFDEEMTTEKLKDWFTKKTRYKNIHFHTDREFNVEKGLKSYIAKHKPSILSMTTHSRKFPQTIWTTSWTNKLLNNTTLPLLILHTHKEK